MVWTPTVVICNPVATVLGNTDLAVDLYLIVLAGVIWEHIPACRFLLWIFYCGKTVYKTVLGHESIFGTPLLGKTLRGRVYRKGIWSFGTFALIDKLLAINGLGSCSRLAGLQERDQRMPREHWHRPRLHVGPNCGKRRERGREKKWNVIMFICLSITACKQKVSLCPLAACEVLCDHHCCWSDTKNHTLTKCVWRPWMELCTQSPSQHLSPAHTHADEPSG